MSTNEVPVHQELCTCSESECLVQLWKPTDGSKHLWGASLEKGVCLMEIFIQSPVFDHLAVKLCVVGLSVDVEVCPVKAKTVYEIWHTANVVVAMFVSVDKNTEAWKCIVILDNVLQVRGGLKTNVFGLKDVSIRASLGHKDCSEQRSVYTIQPIQIFVAVRNHQIMLFHPCSVLPLKAYIHNNMTASLRNLKSAFEQLQGLSNTCNACSAV